MCRLLGLLGVKVMEPTCGILPEPIVGGYFYNLRNVTYSSSWRLQWFPAKNIHAQLIRKVNQIHVPIIYTREVNFLSKKKIQRGQL